MAAVVAIGEPARLEGFALAGVEVLAAADPAAVRAAWSARGAGAGVVLLTPAARAAVGELPEVAPGQPLVVVLPP